MSTGEERRARRAARTLDVIVGAGSDLFDRLGLIGTTVDQIAEQADVSPATVYSIAGGKSGILTALMDRWVGSAEAIDVEAGLAGAESVADLVNATSRAAARIQDEHWKTMRLALAIAPHDEGARQALDTALSRYYGALDVVAKRIVQLVPERSLDASAVGEQLWFYFGYGSWGTTIKGFGWSVERAREWLVEQALHSLG